MCVRTCRQIHPDVRHWCHECIADNADDIEENIFMWKEQDAAIAAEAAKEATRDEWLAWLDEIAPKEAR